MNTAIYYFSGRGNSLAVASGLQERFPGASLRPIAAGTNSDAGPCARLGLVLPVIDIGIPALVRRFISQLSSRVDSPYVFAVITCAGMPGSSPVQVEKLLKRRKLKLSAAWTVQFGLAPKSDAEWNALLDGIATAVKSEQSIPLAKVPFQARMLTGIANPLARLIIPGEDRKFRVGESCTGCGICAKICPARNITIECGKPVWHHRCEQCAACFGWCPQKAISGKNLAARTRFTNPRVSLGQMMADHE